MAERVFLRVSEDHDQVFVVRLNDQGHLTAEPETLSLAVATERVGGASVTVLLPADEVVGCIAAIPAAGPAKLRQMLPFSLEDEFAGDIEDLHFVPGERNDAGDLMVSVIGRDRIGFWIDRLQTAGIQASRLCSEADGVPDTPGTVTLILDRGRVLGRRPGGAPFAFEGISLPNLWSLLAAEKDDQEDLRQFVLFADTEAARYREGEIEALRSRVDDLSVRELTGSVLPRLASGLVHRPGPNLLQGSFSNRTDLRKLARPWRAAAGVALAFLAISVIGKGAELIKLNREESRLTSEATTICAESYGSQSLARCLADMSRRLAESGQVSTAGSSLFFPTLMAIAGSVDNAMSIITIGYAEDVTTLDVLAPTASYLDAFSQQLETQGFVVNLQNTVNEDDAIRVRLRITGAEQ